jgi:hypothetical protein
MWHADDSSPVRGLLFSGSPAGAIGAAQRGVVGWRSTTPVSPCFWRLAVPLPILPDGDDAGFLAHVWGAGEADGISRAFLDGVSHAGLS